MRPRHQTIVAGVLTALAVVALLWPAHAQINLPTIPTPIAKGGTGQTTATAAFDALSPVTTRGDLIFRDASNNVRLAKGTSGQFLSIGANDPAWAAVPAFTGQLAAGDASGLNPVDGLTYYIGTLFGVDPATGDDTPGYYIGRSGKLVAVYGRVTTAGTLGSNENVTLIVRKNGSTDILTVTSTMQLTAAATEFSSTGNAIAVSAGDRLYFKMVCPTWATNPTLVFLSGVLYFEAP